MDGHSNENWTFDTDSAKQAQEVFFFLQSANY